MSGTSPIRVLLVDDSTIARAMLRSILEEDGDFIVVGEARNGREAVDQVVRLRPDLVTMDLDMPVMGGLEAIEEIMGVKAVPILVVSSVADAQRAYAAVARGAIEVINKPTALDADIADFVDKAKLVASIPVITHVRLRHQFGRGAPVSVTVGSSVAAEGGAARSIDGPVVAIAASTGGPQALAQLLGALPADFRLPILVAQHIADGFAQGLVDWLATQIRLPIRLACDGERMAAGVVHLSPSESNLTVDGQGRLALTARPTVQIYRPSCDVLLTSVAAAFAQRAVGIILTGMGSDGVRGMEAINRAGGATLAQDEGSSVIFGMNAVAIERGWVRRVLPVDRLSSALIALDRESRLDGGGTA
jgi:two-component system chemotaxis response regulator CheB